MRICLLVDPARLSRWHLWLAADLALPGRDVQFCRADTSRNWPTSLDIALRLDRLIHRAAGEHALDRVSLGGVDLRTSADLKTDPPDLLIDCASGLGDVPLARRVLTPVFSGSLGELGALAALLDGREIEIAVTDSSTPGAASTARPAVADRISLSTALDNIMSRAVELLVDLARAPRTEAPADTSGNRPRAAPTAHGAPSAWAAYGHLAQVVAGKLGRKLSKAVRERDRWALAVRRYPGACLIDGTGPSEARFPLIRDDGRRFYADPMLVEHNGTTWLFCEEFPFETERGIISVAEVHADGTVGPFRPVLERPYHLSYPFVFEDGGQIWMIPETAEGGVVELYRSVEFPFTWQHERNLIDGIPGCDATLLRRDGTYTLFLTTTHRLSTSWDNLRIYESPSLSDPFRPHETGLVAIDARRTRSAGAFIRRGPDLLRPTQDCSEMYGGRIVLSRVDQLSRTAYSQTELAEIVASGPPAITGTHTYARSGACEAVDVWGAFEGVNEVTLTLRNVPERHLGRTHSEVAHAR